MPAVEWFLVACAAHARVMQRERGLPMELRASFSHPESRLRASELGDDRPGRERADQGFGGMAYEPRQELQRKEQRRFAHELADYLEEGARTQAYGSLVVFAGNPFLGELREALGDGTQRLLKISLPVDLSHVGSAELERRMHEELASA